MEVLFQPKSSESDRDRQDENLYQQLCDPSVRLQLVKKRDGYVSFTILSDFEKQTDEILSTCITRKSDTNDINEIHIVSPTHKTVGIHKMLKNQVYIEEAGGPKQWSGFNLEYQQRLQYMDLRKFLSYLWGEQLLNYIDGGSKVCKLKLEKYVKGVLTDLNCDSKCDATTIDQVVEHVKQKYVSDLEMIILSTVNSFVYHNDLVEMFQRFVEWKLVIGVIPFVKSHVVDTVSLKHVKQLDGCFKLPTLQNLLTIRNTIPPLEEVLILSKRHEIEFWHLPTKTKLETIGNCNIRSENKEICLGTEGESLFYSELRVMHLNEKHYECLKPQRYVLVELPKEETKLQLDKKDDGQSPLFSTLTKTQTALFDENNPLSNYSQIQDKTNNLQNFIDLVSNEMRDINSKMDLFLNDVSPGDRNTLADAMVSQGLESFLRTIKPKMDEWENKLRDHLNQFRMHAVKQLASMPKGLYEFQERAAELNLNNNIEIEDFVEELSSTNVSRPTKLPDISDLEDFDRSELGLKQMQNKMNQYFDLATKFMSYLKDAQKIIAKLRLDDSVKDLRVKTLTEQKKEIVKLANKFRSLCNKQIEAYQDKFKALKKEMDDYIRYQNKTMAKTKQHFLNIRDMLLTRSGEWSHQHKTREDSKRERLLALQENFLKQHDSTSNHLNQNTELAFEKISVNGTVRQAELKCRIDDNTLMMYRDKLKLIWKGVLNNLVSIQETVTKNGVQLYNVDEEHMLQKHILTFFRIIYDRNFFLTRKGLDEFASIYGVKLSIEIIIRKLLKSNSESNGAKLIRKSETTTEETTGVLLEN